MSETQYMDALQEANRVRLARAQLKRDVTAGETTVATVILTCPWMARTMPVSDLLKAQWQWGNTKVQRFLRSLHISEYRTVGELTASQRERVVSRLAGGDAAVREAEDAETVRRWAQAA